MPYKAWAGLLQCWRRGGNGFMLLSFLRQRSQATEEVELKLQTLRSLALSGRNQWREKAAGEIKKKEQTTWSWENQVSKCFCAVGCVFLQCPCLVLCSQSIAKELVASHGESCFHLCMVQPGRSFLWHRVRLKKNKKNAPRPPAKCRGSCILYTAYIL